MNGHLGGFYLGATMSSAAVDMRTHLHMDICSITKTPKSGMAGSYDRCRFNFLKNFLFVFQHGGTVLHLTTFL